VSVSLAGIAGVLDDAELRGGDVGLRDASHRSEHVGPDWLFCAVPGSRADGHDHAPQAIANGAAGVLVERWLDVGVPQLRVASVRRAMGPAAAIVHDRPSDRLTVVGVTGTNGKTTVTTLVEAAFAAAGTGVGVVGTLGARVHGRSLPGERTTPEGPDLQRLLGRAHELGADAVAMEVSSHGLDLHRVDGTRFAVAVFTNLTQDHLDWHGTMEAYLAAKARLFTPELSRIGVVDLDGARSRDLVALARIPLVTVGEAPDADHRIVSTTIGAAGGRATLVGPHGRLEVVTRLTGRYNLGNAVTAFVAATTAGVPVDAALEGIARAAAPPGRLEQVRPAGTPDDAPRVLVDYAHTPDAVAATVAAVRGTLGPGGRLAIVLGAGGDRDADKRGPMGVAAADADLVVVTDDNPRSEHPDRIVEAIVAGVRAAVESGAPARLHVERDRERAIAHAIAAMGPADVVLVAGKGHETGQEVGGVVRPFDDREVAGRVLLGGRP
jgi:UDP-N-acetylmuramoyl-L-alanyl-D-glutamate--2,6-diaminopimelate ligase